MDYTVNLRPGILYTCCPYVTELKVIMSQFHTGFKAPKTVTTTETKHQVTFWNLKSRARLEGHVEMFLFGVVKI